MYTSEASESSVKVTSVFTGILGTSLASRFPSAFHCKSFAFIITAAVVVVVTHVMALTVIVELQEGKYRPAAAHSDLLSCFF